MVDVEANQVTIDYLTLTEKMPLVFRRPIKSFKVTKEFLSKILEENKANVDIDKCQFYALLQKPYQKIYLIKVVDYLIDGYEVVYNWI